MYSIHTYITCYLSYGHCHVLGTHQPEPPNPHQHISKWSKDKFHQHMNPSGLQPPAPPPPNHKGPSDKPRSPITMVDHLDHRVVHQPLDDPFSGT